MIHTFLIKYGATEDYPDGSTYPITVLYANSINEAFADALKQATKDLGTDYDLISITLKEGS